MTRKGVIGIMAERPVRGATKGGLPFTGTLHTSSPNYESELTRGHDAGEVEVDPVTFYRGPALDSVFVQIPPDSVDLKSMDGAQDGFRRVVVDLGKGDETLFIPVP